MSAEAKAAWCKVVPLGGLGHIGGNLMVYETEDDLFLVDCGVLFPTVEEPGIDYVVPNIGYVLERRDKLRGIVLTHGHEDHIGALPFLLPMLGKTKLYATRFTAALIRNKMNEHLQVPFELITIGDRRAFALGKVHVEALAVTHSIPDAVALAMATPAGLIVHTGDFKIDPDPLDGRLTDEAGFKALGRAGVALLCSDSTNSLKPGRTWSEREVQVALREVIGAAEHRVFLTTFASHIDRIQAVCDAAAAAGRHVVALGRSMRNNIGIAREIGLLKVAEDLIVDVEEFPRLPRNKVVVLASGSQGEAFSSMARIAQDRFDPVTVDKGDLVIFSSRRIPGNERAISSMTNDLVRLGARIVGDHEARVHSSGHAFNDEQEDMIRWCAPRHFIPLHGELRHMVAHAKLAGECGVDPQNVYVLEDGWPIILEKKANGKTEARRLDEVDHGLLFVDGKGIGDVGEIVLRDRRYLSEAGIVACVIVLSAHGEVVLPPELVTRGLVYVDENQPLLERAQKGVSKALQNADTANSDDVREQVRSSLRRFFKQTLGRKPVIVPVILRLPDTCCD